MLATLTRPVTTTLVVWMGDSAFSSGTRPARRAARASSAIVGISSAPRRRRRRRPRAAASASAASKLGAGPAPPGAGRRRPATGRRRSTATGSSVRRPRRPRARRTASGVSTARRPISAAPASTSAVASMTTGSAGASDGLDHRLDERLGDIGLDGRSDHPASSSGMSRLGASGSCSAIAAKRVGSSSAKRRSKKAAISASKAATRALDPLDPPLDRAGVRPRAPRSRSALRSEMRLVGLLADPGDLGLRPVADARDVVIGHACAARPPLRRRRHGWPRRAALASALNRSSGLVAGGLRGGLHGAGQVGHELVGLLARGLGRRGSAAASATGSVSLTIAGSTDGRLGDRLGLDGASGASAASPSDACTGTSRLGRGIGRGIGRGRASVAWSASAGSVPFASASARSELHGSRKPGCVSVVAMR